MTSTETIERSKQMYERYLTPDIRADLERMDDGNKDFFWAYLYFTAPTEVGRIVVRGIQEAVERNVKPIPEESQSATPFSDAERSISAHGYFSVRRLI